MDILWNIGRYIGGCIDILWGIGGYIDIIWYGGGCVDIILDIACCIDILCVEFANLVLGLTVMT